MLRLIVRRLALGLLVALTVMTLAFMLTRLSGDLAISIAGPQATQADIEIVRKAYGLDRPLYVQFFAWVGRAMVGDFGQSYFFKDSVANLIARRMPITLTLGLVGLSLALIISIPLGILAAVRENTWIDRAVTMFTMVGQAMPSFWLALDPDDRARPAPRRPADLRHRHLAALRDARHRARLHGDPGADAADALRHDRGDGVGLHPHGARQGPVARAHHLQARAAQCRDSRWCRSRRCSSASCSAARS